MKILGMTGVGLMNIRAMIVISRAVSGTPLEKQVRTATPSLSFINTVLLLYPLALASV